MKKEEEPAKLPAPAQQQAQPPPAQQLSGADELVQLDRAIEEASAYGWVSQTDSRHSFQGGARAGKGQPDGGGLDDRRLLLFVLLLG